MDKSQFVISDFQPERFIQACLTVPEFSFIAQLLAKKSVDWYVVGGCVRDYVLTQHLALDIDIVVHPKWVDTVVSALHNEFGMRIVTLDEDLGIYRAIDPQKKYYFDIAAMQGHTIEMDLARRDLSMNAIAINIQTRKLIDPYDGLLAILEKRIEAISEVNFVDDPLRLLRVYRFYAQLPDFAITNQTSEMIRSLIEAKTVSLRRVAIERIHDELYKLLLGKNALNALQECVEQKILLPSFPGFPQAVWQKFTLLFKLGSQLEPTLWRMVIKDPILTMWLSLVAIQQVKLSDFTILLERYKWSQYQRSIILRVMTFLSQNDSPEITDDFFDSLGQDALPYWIYAYMSMSMNKIENATEENVITDVYIQPYNVIWQMGLDFWEREKDIPKLLSGSDLTKYFNKESGPWVGAALALLRSAQRQNKVHDYKEALEFLRHALANESKKT